MDKPIFLSPESVFQNRKQFLPAQRSTKDLGKCHSSGKTKQSGKATSENQDASSAKPDEPRIRQWVHRLRQLGYTKTDLLWVLEHFDDRLFEHTTPKPKPLSLYKSRSLPTESTDDADAMLRLVLVHLTRHPNTTIETLCGIANVKPRRLWLMCRERLNLSSKDLVDWAKAERLLTHLSTETMPSEKLVSNRMTLGFKSGHPFWKFTKRVFGCSACEVRRDMASARRRLEIKYSTLMKMQRPDVV